MWGEGVFEFLDRGLHLGEAGGSLRDQGTRLGPCIVAARMPKGDLGSDRDDMSGAIDEYKRGKHDSSYIHSVPDFPEKCTRY